MYDIKIIGKQKLCLYFNNFEAVIDFNSLNLVEHNIKTSIPLHYLTTTGIIKNIPAEVKMEKLVNLTDNEDIYKLERIYRRDRDIVDELVLIPTSCVKIIFNLQMLPENISLKYYKEKVHPFIYRVRQCSNCWNFGHTHHRCKAPKKCNNCEEEHNESQCRVNHEM
jgi:hypothetical protein